MGNIAHLIISPFAIIIVPTALISIKIILINLFQIVSKRTNGNYTVVKNTQIFIIYFRQLIFYTYPFIWHYPHPPILYTDYQDNNIVTYYNNNIKHKRFYKSTLKCGNKKYDIRDYFWAGNASYVRDPKDFGISVVNISGNTYPNTIFSYNHKTDLTYFNGDFDESNYPLKRLLDIGNINSCEKLTFTCSSCSYEIDVDVEDDPPTIELKPKQVDYLNKKILRKLTAKYFFLEGVGEFNSCKFESCY